MSADDKVARILPALHTSDRCLQALKPPMQRISHLFVAQNATNNFEMR